MWLRIGAISALLAVVAGAFGAHVLESRVDARAAHNFEVAARYQIYHALGLLLLAAFERRLGPSARLAGWLFLLGTIVFSGSLYALVLTGARWWGALTPVGGVAFVLGWLVLALAAGRSNPRRRW